MLISTQTKAADIETLVMPGEVISAHADMENTCSSCHKVFDKAGQTKLCTDCHKDVATDITQSNGFHGKSTIVEGQQCSTCHSDHLGRNASIVDFDEETFDHIATDFLLRGAHELIQCVDCHESDQKFRDAAIDCFGCHSDDDSHAGALGESCGDCHNESAWSEVSFDHSLTDFPLRGMHSEVACLDCHKGNVFDGLADTCYSCHAADDVHNGLSGKDCQNCHSPNGWDDTSFDHQRDTQFPLLESHAEVACNGCHSADPFVDQLDRACVSCHLEDDNHNGHFGDDCSGCHAVAKWIDVTFDHDIETNYPLKGAHAAVGCNDCHVQPIFEVPLQSGCIDCHVENDVHKGDLGVQCDGCHSQASWSESIVFDHDLSDFPLLGKHNDTSCESCHESQSYSDAPLDCAACHADDDPHQDRFGQACDGCHNPVDWNIWFFNHESQTDFPLSGAHAVVTCNACHRKPLDSMTELGQSCGDCHRSDDVHDSQFGSDCGRCHTADSFTDVRSLK